MSLTITVRNKEVSTLKDWENAFNDKKHWKEGRSAYSLADFILNRNGLKIIAEKLQQCGIGNIDFLSCDVEASVKFDNYKRKSQRDMVLIGKLENNNKIFITVEAKVDESFGCTIENSLKSQNTHRAKELLEKFIPHHSEQDKKLRYQLFHAAAATIEKGDYGQNFQKSIMLVLVFKTTGFENEVNYNEKKGENNYKEFCRFMQAIGADKKKENDVWTLNFQSKEIAFIYSQIEFKNLHIQ